MRPCEFPKCGRGKSRCMCEGSPPDAEAVARELPTFTECAVCGSTDQGDDYSAPGTVGLCFKHTPGAVPSDYGIALDAQYDEADALAFWLSYNLRGNWPLLDGAELAEILRDKMARDREAVERRVRAAEAGKYAFAVLSASTLGGAREAVERFARAAQDHHTTGGANDGR